MSFFGMFNNKDKKPGTKKTDSFKYEIASDITTSAVNSTKSINGLKTKNDINDDTIFPS